MFYEWLIASKPNLQDAPTDSRKIIMAGVYVALALVSYVVLVLGNLPYFSGPMAPVDIFT